MASSTVAPAASVNVPPYPSVNNIPCANPAPKPPFTAYDSIITIKVLEYSRNDKTLTTSKDFHAYHGVLCFYSDFFNRALNGPFKEARSTVYEVSDCTVRTFAVFFYWMNTGILTAENGGQRLNERDAVNLHVFADFYAIPALKNRTSEHYFLSFAACDAFDFPAIVTIYKRTPENSRMRKLVVDLLVDIWSFKTFRKYCNGLEDLAADLVEACIEKRITPGHSNLNDGRQTEGAWKDDMRQHFCARYHEHSEVTRDGVDVGSTSQGN